MKSENFTWSVGYQNRVKKVIGVHFWRNFWKIIKNEDFGFDILEKGQILRPFSGVATSKLRIFKKFNGSICAYFFSDFHYLKNWILWLICKVIWNLNHENQLRIADVGCILVQKRSNSLAHTLQTYFVILWDLKSIISELKY